MTMVIPKHLQSLFWSTNADRLDQEKDKAYIIHQVLIYGTLADIRWLFQTYPKPEIIRVFLTTPYKNYPRAVFHFIKNYILKLKDQTVDEELYVTSIHGSVRPRAAERL